MKFHLDASGEYRLEGIRFDRHETGFGVVQLDLVDIGTGSAGRMSMAIMDFQRLTRAIHDKLLHSEARNPTATPAPIVPE